MKRERIDYEKEVGKKYGRLTIKEIKKENRKKAIAVCICECGGTKETQFSNLKNKKTLSCGCLNNEQRHRLDNKPRTHGMYTTKIYHVWQGIKRRCSDINNPNYGGRGIKMYKEWENSFEKFYEWAINNGYKEIVDEKGRALITIDRIDNNKGYYPENCRWVDYSVQNSNKRNSFLTREEIDFINNSGNDYNVIRSRMKRHKLSVEDAIKKPKYIHYSTYNK